MSVRLDIRWWLIFLSLFTPFAWLLWTVIRLQRGEWDILGPEPGKAVVWFCGSWAFNLLLLTLAVTPAKRWLGWSWLMRYRRMAGLWTFFYLTLHLLAYAALLLEWQWHEIGSELIKRPYLLFGMAGWLLMVPLAVTSTKGWQRRLRQNWKKLHKLVYAIAILASIHYLLQIRSSWFEPVLYTLIVAVLLLARMHRKTFV
ncbi:sulfite oxidase heme-binding subunit YedZ [Thalassolituus sp. LLYu03]|uniref:sulfite oxidase heme-binding subunit YedZ n=1 Tax=Thalassolituus sp. LLYu03 TaxID=3421656 RepID=UPI003D2E61C7